MHHRARPSAVFRPLPRLAAAGPLAAGLLLLTGCERGASGTLHAAAPRADSVAIRATDRSVARGDRVAASGDVTPPGVQATRPAYQVTALAGAGSVTGVVVLDGAPPADTALTPAPGDQRACGTTVRDGGVDVDGAQQGVRGAVVWLEGVSAGKPLPGTRRHELALDRCQLVPRALAVAAGGTLNVHGVDALASRLRFARAGGPDAGRVLLRTAMSDAGQVVPDERVLAEPGAVEVRGEGRPWLRAWVLAFDHPYFASTGAGGAFALGDVPPGQYRLVAWHERLGRVVTPVAVAAGQAAAVTVRLGPGGGAPAADARPAAAR